MTISSREQALTYLQTNPLRHLVHLKFLHLYGEAIHVTTLTHGDDIGILLSYPIHVSGWDQSAYPTADSLLLPLASNNEMAKQLVATVQTRYSSSARLVMKFCDSLTRDIFKNALPLTPTRILLSYTSDVNNHSATMRDSEVHVIESPDESLLELFCRNGYTLDELRGYFADGAIGFAVYEGESPACACFVYRNFGDVWEIAGVHTVESARRKGYAGRVVQSALYYLLEAGRIPRYQTESTNSASLHLAESLGLSACLRFEHFVTGDFSS